MKTTNTSINTFFGSKVKINEQISEKAIPASQKVTPKIVDLVSSETMGLQVMKSEHLYDNGQIIPESDYERFLEDFDYNIYYGPVVGISRMARFERAQKLDCNPPSYIKDIILRRPDQECFLNTCDNL